jgi:hypothetical protein
VTHIRGDMEDRLTLLLLYFILFVIATHHLPVLKNLSRPEIICKVLIVKKCNEMAFFLEGFLIANDPVSEY